MKYIEKLDYLDEYLDDFIDRVVISRRFYNEETQMEEYKQNIELKYIIESSIKEEEYDYAFDYFKKKGIIVTGNRYALCGYYDNYKYIPHNNRMIYFTEEEKMEDITEEIKEYKKMKDGEEKDKKKDLIIRNNLPLVRSITNKYIKVTGIEFDELFGYGCIGLIYALDKYDESSNTKFSSFAMEAISGYILKNIPGILGFNDRNLYYKILKIKKELNTEDVEEIADVLVKESISITKSERIRQININNPLSTEEIDIIDMDDPIEKEEQKLFSTEAEMKMLDIIEKYDPYGILVRYYGLGEYEARNDTKIAKELGYSRQHINKVKKKALKKMSDSEEIKTLNRERYN